MLDQFSRTELLLGNENMMRLKNSRVADIYETCICPPGTARKCTQRRQIPGSNAFVPSVAGLIIAGEVIKDLTRRL